MAAILALGTQAENRTGKLFVPRDAGGLGFEPKPSLDRHHRGPLEGSDGSSLSVDARPMQGG